jgi:hypothetical protein
VLGSDRSSAHGGLQHDSTRQPHPRHMHDDPDSSGCQLASVCRLSLHTTSYRNRMGDCSAESLLRSHIIPCTACPTCTLLPAMVARRLLSLGSHAPPAKLRPGSPSATPSICMNEKANDQFRNPVLSSLNTRPARTSTSWRMPRHATTFMNSGHACVHASGRRMLPLRRALAAAD